MAGYSRIQSLYMDVCSAYRISAFPITETSVSVFIAHLCRQGLKPRTLKGYMAAILKKNQSLKFTVSPSLQVHIHDILKGAENSFTEEHGPAPLRDVLTAQQAVELSQQLVQQCRAQTSSSRVRMLAAVVFGFLFASRATTIVSALAGDLCVRGSSLVFLERKRKMKQAQGLRELCVPVACCLASALVEFMHWSRFQGVSAQSSLFGLKGRYHGQVITSALQHVLGQQRVSSHMLRRGAAVAMLAAKVPMPRILSWGGWATEASVKPYLHGREFVSVSSHDLACFSWMASTEAISGTVALRNA